MWLLFSHRMDLSTLTLDMDITTPSMVFNADYEMDGRILLVPLNGKGDCVLNFSKYLSVLCGDHAIRVQTYESPYTCLVRATRKALELRIAAAGVTWCSGHMLQVCCSSDSAVSVLHTT